MFTIVTAGIFLSTATSTLPKRPSCAKSLPPAARVDCGYQNISKQLCFDRGCCFDASTAVNVSASCYFGSGPAAQIRKVHVIISNHFDAGYTDLTASSESASDFAEIFMRHHNISGRPSHAAISAGVINSYFHDFFPLLFSAVYQSNKNVAL